MPESPDPNQNHNNQQPPAVNVATVIPEMYREKPYLKGVDSFDKLFSLLDSSQRLIGSQERIAIPDFDKASDEELNDFYSKVRKLEKPDEYEFDIDKVPENMRASKDHVDFVKDLFFKAGLNKKQASLIQKGFTEHTMKILNAQEAEKKKENEEFEKLTGQIFGKDKEKILNESRKFIMDSAPESLKKRIAEMPNEDLVLLASSIQSFKTKFLKEDNLSGGDHSGGKTVDDLREERRKIMGSEAFRNPMHPDHKGAKSRLDEIYETLKKKN